MGIITTSPLYKSIPMTDHWDNAYYKDINLAIARNPAFVHCGHFEQLSDFEYPKGTGCKSIPKVLLVTPGESWWPYQDMQHLSWAKAKGLPIVIMMEHVYYSGRILPRLQMLHSHRRRVLAALTWSPNYGRMADVSAVPFHWVPFAANYDKFGHLKQRVEAQTKQPFKYRYDIGFTGVCSKLGYLTRWQICQRWHDMYKAGIVLSPNLRPGSKVEHYSSAKYREVMAESKLWLATTGWHEYVGIKKRDKPQWFNRRAVDQIFPHGVDLVGTRFFEVMSTGTTLVLCDRLSIYKNAKLFEDKKHVVMFDGFDDLLQKVRA
jgi:hypothetical protein